MNGTPDDFVSISQEQSFLGSILETPELYQPGLVTVDDFTTPLHRQVWRYLSEAEDRGLTSVIAGLVAARKITSDDTTIVSGMLDEVLARTPKGLESIALCLRELRAKRRAVSIVGGMADAAGRGQLSDLGEMLPALQKALNGQNALTRSIRRLSDIPDIMTADLKPPEWLCDGIIGRNWITVWMGAPKSGKSIAMMHLAQAVSRGLTFLERRCTQTKVLIVDYEMAPVFARQRIELMGYGRAESEFLSVGSAPS
jgi:hypothetical protein